MADWYYTHKDMTVQYCIMILDYFCRLVYPNRRNGWLPHKTKFHLSDTLSSLCFLVQETRKVLSNVSKMSNSVARGALTRWCHRHF